MFFLFTYDLLLLISVFFCRQLREGELLVLDESFEQEVWLRSAEPAVVMVIDVWHPDLDEAQRRKLGPVQ